MPAPGARVGIRGTPGNGQRGGGGAASEEALSAGAADGRAEALLHGLVHRMEVGTGRKAIVHEVLAEVSPGFEFPRPAGPWPLAFLPSDSVDPGRALEDVTVFTKACRRGGAVQDVGMLAGHVPVEVVLILENLAAFRALPLPLRHRLFALFMWQHVVMGWMKGAVFRKLGTKR